MKVNKFLEIVELASGVSAQEKDGILTVAGPKGSVVRKLSWPGIEISVEGSKISLKADDATKSEKRMLYTFLAHVENMVAGVQKPYVYKMKVLSGHFPMTVTASGDKFSVKNYLGEKIPRAMSLKKGVTVKIEGQIVTVEGPDKEIVGNVVSDIEQLMRITNRDRRIFQDGIFLIEKDGIPL